MVTKSARKFMPTRKESEFPIFTFSIGLFLFFLGWLSMSISNESDATFAEAVGNGIGGLLFYIVAIFLMGTAVLVFVVRKVQKIINEENTKS